MSYLEGKYTAAKYGSCMIAAYEELINKGYDPQDALSELNIL